MVPSIALALVVGATVVAGASYAGALTIAALACHTFARRHVHDRRTRRNAIVL